MTNAFVYGGRYAATQPAAVWSRPVKAVFGFFFPMAFTGYLPVVTLLGLPGVEWLPRLARLVRPAGGRVGVDARPCSRWRWGVRHYQGGGG